MGNIFSDMKKVIKQAEKLDGKTVTVGVFCGGEAEKIAGYQANGTSTIPKRPFADQALKAKKSEIFDYCKEAVTDVCEGQNSAKGALNEIGEKCADSMKAFISANAVTPPSQMQHKKNRITLIETGKHIVSNIDYKVE